MKIGICIPSCRPDFFQKYILATIHHLNAIREQSVFLINFNGPWTKEQAKTASEIIESKGWKIKYVVTGVWDRPVKIAKIREIAAWLDTSVDAYMVGDDDFRFTAGTPSYPRTSGQRYAEMIDYMSRFPNCGSVQARYFLGGTPQGYKIFATWKYEIGSDHGFLLRNMFNEYGWCLTPPEAQEFRGAFEETIMVYSRIERGYWCATQMNNPTAHPHFNNSKVLNLLKIGDPADQFKDEMLHPSVTEVNNLKYIRERWKCPDWKYGKFRPPDACLRSYFLKTGEHYPWHKANTIDYR